jgi:hypothetical protein
MGLNIVSSGEFKPYAKYNAKSGRWYVKKDDAEQEVANPTFVADFENIKTGWFLFLEGQAPNIVYDANLQTPAAKPSDAHKRGFEIELFSQAAFGGVVVMSGASMHTCSAINELYEQYEKDCDVNKGMLPVVQAMGATPMKDKFGTNYRPELKILKWVPRPSELGSATPTQVTPVPQSAAPAASAVSEF